MIEVVDEKMIEWLHKANNEIWPSVMIRDNVPTDIENFVEYSFGNIAKMAGLFSTFRHHIDNEGHLCLIFEHKFGIKWSKMISEVFSESLANLFKIEVKSQALQNTVVITVLEKDLNMVKLKL